MSSAFVAHAVGAPIVITISAGCCAVVVMGMIAVHNVVGVVLVGVFFGFFAGSCKLLIDITLFSECLSRTW